MSKSTCLVILILLVACAPKSNVEPLNQLVLAIDTPAAPQTSATAPTRPPLSASTPTASATPIATATPSPTATATPSPQPISTATLVPLPDKVNLSLTHEYQKWNNCGPVSLAVTVTFYGIARNQLQVAAEVKGAEMDKNVGPMEMQRYLQGVGLSALVRVNGTRQTLQRLLAAGIPVIVQQWLLKSNGELVGHYRVVQGYDLGVNVFITSDPFTPPARKYTFTEFETFWQPWNHRYIVPYRAAQEATVRAILAADFDEEKNWQNALAASTVALRKNPNDAYEFFSLGDDRLALGAVVAAVEAYEKAIALGLPGHFYWYNYGPLEAFYRAGNFQHILDFSGAMMKEASNIEEVRFWRGKAYLALGQKEKAREEFSLAVQFNAHYTEAKAMLEQVR